MPDQRALTPGLVLSRSARDANAAYRRAKDLAMATLKENPTSGYPRGYIAYIAARLGDRKRAEDEIAQLCNCHLARLRSFAALY